MVGEAINKTVDLNTKKKQLLSSLTEAKLLPQIDERLRKQIKELKEFMTKEQLTTLFKLKVIMKWFTIISFNVIISFYKEIKDPESLEMLTQFLSLLKSGKDRPASGMMGLPQFLTFLNKSQNEPDSSGQTRTSISAKNSPRTQSRSTLPRPSTAG